MKNPQRVAEIVERSFSKVHREKMQGIPILNPRINVQALGFQYYRDRIVGIVITPWLMNVIILPAEGEDWSDRDPGRKEMLAFPLKTCLFLQNEIDGIGYCQTHSLYSPMNEFANHEHAVRVGQDFIEKLMTVPEQVEEDPVDENLLGRIMRGEETPEVNLDDFATIEPHDGSKPVKGLSDTRKPLKGKLDRRALLRGRFLEDG